MVCVIFGTGLGCVAYCHLHTHTDRQRHTFSVIIIIIIIMVIIINGTLLLLLLLLWLLLLLLLLLLLIIVYQLFSASLARAYRTYSHIECVLYSRTQRTCRACSLVSSHELYNVKIVASRNSRVILLNLTA
jgi:predicted membrane protein